MIKLEFEHVDMDSVFVLLTFMTEANPFFKFPFEEKGVAFKHMVPIYGPSMLD